MPRRNAWTSPPVMGVPRPSTDTRRAAMGKVRLGAQALGLEDGDRRALQQRVTGHDSLAAMTDRQIGRVIEELGRLGAYGPAGKRAGSRPMASSPHAKKCRALWLSLYHLAAVDDPSEAALAAFVRRQIGVDALQFVDADQAYRAIEALKGWCQREGFDAPKDGLAAKHALIRVLWRRVTGLGAVDAGTHLDVWIAETLRARCRPLATLEPRQADRVIEALGALNRHALATRAGNPTVNPTGAS